MHKLRACSWVVLVSKIEEFRVRPTPRVLPQPRSHRSRQVWLGLEILGRGGGRGGGWGVITFASATAIRTCKTQYFGNPHAKTPHSCLTASDYQSIPAQTIMTFISRVSHYQNIHAQTITTFMFESTPLLDHPSPSHKHVCVTSASKYQKHCTQWDEVYVLPTNIMLRLF